MVTNTASIGNAVLKSALSLQSNYSVAEDIAEIDRLGSGCYQCAAYLEGNNDLSELCENCLSKVCKHQTKKIYINEANRYGIRPILKRNALLLFIYLHFLNPDSRGLVRLDIEDAAEALHCTERTIKNNIRLLNERNYIITTLNPIIPGFYHIFLTEYKSYFLPANQGGRGYSIISHECFDQFVKMPDINSLRLAIRNLLPDIEPKKSVASHGYEKSYHDVMRVLPEYVTKTQIKHLVDTDEFKQLFYVKTKKRFIVIEAKDDFKPSRIANSLRQDCRDKLLKTVDEINKTAQEQKKRFKLHLSEEEITDICNISLKVHIPYIIAAVQEVYSDYTSKNMHVQNFGALVRAIAEYKAAVLPTA